MLGRKSREGGDRRVVELVKGNGEVERLEEGAEPADGTIEPFYLKKNLDKNRSNRILETRV